MRMRPDAIARAKTTPEGSVPERTTWNTSSTSTAPSPTTLTETVFDVCPGAKLIGTAASAAKSGGAVAVPLVVAAVRETGTVRAFYSDTLNVMTEVPTVAVPGALPARLLGDGYGDGSAVTFRAAASAGVKCTSPSPQL